MHNAWRHRPCARVARVTGAGPNRASPTNRRSRWPGSRRTWGRGLPRGFVTHRETRGGATRIWGSIHSKQRSGNYGAIKRTEGVYPMTAPARLSYSHGASPDPLLGETIGDNLRRIAARYPGREVLVDVLTGRRWTYARFDADTGTLARGLIAAGIEAGDRVGIWSPNCAEWVLLQYATAKAGVVLVNINPAYRSHELGYVLRQSCVRMLVSAESFKTSNYRAMIEEVRGDLDALEQVVYLGSPEWDALMAAGVGQGDGGAG